MGQVYVPRVNWALMVATVLIVIGFRSSGAMAAAYGIAVTLTMIITVLLLYVVMTERWQWPVPIAGLVMGIFLTIDLAFFGANALEDRAGRLAAAGGGDRHLHADDDVAHGPADRGGTAGEPRGHD